MTSLLRHCCALFLLATFFRAEAPFSWESTPGRLPKNIVPLRYNVRVEPDMEKATFRGSETVTIEVREPAKAIILHSSGLEITDATLKSGAVTPLQPQFDPTE